MVSSVQGNQPAAPFDPKGGGAVVATEPNDSLDKDSFMKLLVAQLSHQDPMSPTDPTEFVSQLSQFSQLEQLVGVQQGLDLIAITQTAGTSAQMVSFIGKEVQFEGNSLAVTEGDTRLPVQIDLATSSSETQLTITDDKGTVVEQIDLGAMPEGARSYYIDVEKHGLEPGTYNLALSAKDSAGASIEARLQGRAEVTAVTFEAGFPELVLADGRRLSLSQVLQVLDGDSTLPPEFVPAAPEEAAGDAAQASGGGAGSDSKGIDFSHPRSPTAGRRDTP